MPKQKSEPLSVVETEDGSTTLFAPHLGQHYHSIHGAIQESLHVFIYSGLQAFPAEKPVLRIFEMGFGTGLNALLTALERQAGRTEYVAIEAFPVEASEWQGLNYPQELGGDAATIFAQMHAADWESRTEIAPGFFLQKQAVAWEEFQVEEKFDLVYYDAFAPQAQAELWTDEVMESMAELLLPGGVFVTYCAKGSVRRALMRSGLQIDRLPGPPGKREMLRARKAPQR
jgi:tRNA U34 5-methylaminomethyl-2-thiouridine-forming methyltransferase MnmC